VETLPLAKTDKSRDRLLEVIQHDVRRIDRLITDISDASKLDAELNRRRHDRFDLIGLLRHVVNAQSEIARERGQAVKLDLRSPNASHSVLGNDSRLGQVFTNLVDNARSFTPDGGTVTVAVQRFSSFIEVVVDDEGPGIDEAVMERIFERFYTDRSEQQSFGNNSGLGLAISRQIIEAHGGEIFAENRYRTTLGPERDVAGARLTVRLPSAE
jgi:two-component system sensor histidine kinase ChvG